MTAPSGFTIPADHPALPGHFPGNPVVPGVVLLDHVVALAEAAHPGQRVRAMPAVKFLAPVRPAQQVDVSFQAGPGGLAFECAVQGTKVAGGRLILE